MKAALIALLALWSLTAAAGAGDALNSDLLQYTEAPVQAAQLQSLKDVSLPAGTKEVRIWSGFYNVQEFELVRFRIDAAGQVQGESFFIYPPMTGNAAEQPYYDRIAKQCRAFNRTEDWEACRPNGIAGAHWDEAYKALQSLGLWEPPAASKLPAPSPKGGPTVLVELRSGDSYRTYAFNDPGEGKSPQAQKAAKLVAIVNGLVSVNTEEQPEEEDRD